MSLISECSEGELTGCKTFTVDVNGSFMDKLSFYS